MDLGLSGGCCGEGASRGMDDPLLYRWHQRVRISAFVHGTPMG